MIPTVYLAGPDVFRPDAREQGRRMVETCAAHGFRGVFPLEELPPGLEGAAAAKRIYDANVKRLDACDAVVANLDFFRGAEPDSGTCFEVGYAVARGKPVVAYVAEPGSCFERIRRRHPEAVAAGGVDAQGWQFEEFGLPLNLMLAVPCDVVAGGLEAALRALRMRLGALPSPTPKG